MSLRETVARAISRCCKNQSDWNLRLRMADAAILEIEKSILKSSDIAVYLREVDAGTNNACWVVCNKVDPGAVLFTTLFGDAR